jgi:hypothetical protein
MGRDGIPLSGLIPHHFKCYDYVLVVFVFNYLMQDVIKWEKIILDCCWYWRNCLPLLFKLSFYIHNFSLHTSFLFTYTHSLYIHFFFYIHTFSLHTHFLFTYTLSFYIHTFSLHTHFLFTYTLSLYIHTFFLHTHFLFTYTLSFYIHTFFLHT